MKSNLIYMLYTPVYNSSGRILSQNIIYSTLLVKMSGSSKFGSDILSCRSVFWSGKSTIGTDNADWHSTNSVTFGFYAEIYNSYDKIILKVFFLRSA